MDTIDPADTLTLLAILGCGLDGGIYFSFSTCVAATPPVTGASPMVA